MRVLVTGGAGFIGSHFLRYMIRKYPDVTFTNFDKLTYAGNLKNVKDIENHPNYNFIQGDVRDLNFMRYIMKKIDVVFHFAAESHVDRSLDGPIEFTRSNTLGTHFLLETIEGRQLIHISTDEVYGDILEGSFFEEDVMSPANPYSASKAAAEMIIKAYYKTHKTRTIVIRGCNNYGPYQYPEKIIPRFTTSLIQGKKIPLHGEGKEIRCYIHVEDFCRGIDTVFEKGKEGEIYNIGSEYEISNLDVAKKILDIFQMEEDRIEFVPNRPFNDRRYSVDSSKVCALGWRQKINFDEGLQSTASWYRSHPEWWLPIVNSRN